MKLIMIILMVVSINVQASELPTKEESKEERNRMIMSSCVRENYRLSQGVNEFNGVIQRPFFDCLKARNYQFDHTNEVPNENK